MWYVNAMPDRIQESSDFCIEIDFQKGSESPSRVFRAMSELIDAFQAIDIDLIQSIDPKIEPVTLIEDIEAGSIRAWLRYTLRAADDSALKSLDWKPAVGKYLVKAKYLILRFMDENVEIISKEQIQRLTTELFTIAEETNVTHLPAFSPIDRQRLIPDIGRVKDALSHLTEHDKAIYITHDTSTQINARFNYVPENIEQLLTQETIKTRSEMILKVKKPDYLTEAQWEFRHETRTITAKILHTEWLHEFQARQYDVRPGDSLRAIVEISVKYGYDNEVIGSHHDILEVKEIIRVPQTKQLPLLPPDKG